MKENVLGSIRLFLALTVLLGFAYPLVVWAVGQAAFREKANGSFLRVKEGSGAPSDRIVGSALIGQSFHSQKFFHSRPSAAGDAGYDGTASGGTNLGPTSKKLADAIRDRVAGAARRRPVGGRLPRPGRRGHVVGAPASTRTSRRSTRACRSPASPARRTSPHPISRRSSRGTPKGGSSASTAKPGSTSSRSTWRSTRGSAIPGSRPPRPRRRRLLPRLDFTRGGSYFGNGASSLKGAAMAITVKTISLHRTETDDRPGLLADTLAPLATAGNDLRIVMGYKAAGQPGRAVLELFPVKGKKAAAAAAGAGLVASGIPTLLVEGDDRSGLGHDLARAVADAGVDVHFLVAQVVGRKFSAVVGSRERRRRQERGLRDEEGGSLGQEEDVTAIIGRVPKSGEGRPDPESFLRLANRDGKRGHLKVYIGQAAGVGKTFKMLDDAHAMRARGVDVVVALVETHGRAETAARIADLEVVPRRLVEYKGADLEEMDLDAILARKPEVAVVDELAHTNAPGSKNEKRWQDVEDLLASGDLRPDGRERAAPRGRAGRRQVRDGHRRQGARPGPGDPRGGGRRERRPAGARAARPPQAGEGLPAGAGDGGPRELLPRREPPGPARARPARDGRERRPRVHGLCGRQSAVRSRAAAALPRPASPSRSRSTLSLRAHSSGAARAWPDA